MILVSQQHFKIWRPSREYILHC